MSTPRDSAPVAGSICGFDFTRAVAILTDAAARAGAAIMEHFCARTEVEIKGDRTPVTRADRESETIMLEALRRLAPELPVVSEEAGAITTSLGDCFFLLDPLDGTKEFIKKRRDFTVNIALIEKERPRFGLVYAPAQSLLAVTHAEGKAVEAKLPPSAAGVNFASLSHQRLRTRAANPEGLTAFVSLSHLDEETEAFLAKLRLAKRSSVGSSIKFIAIARGDADVYPRFGPTMEWDTAAGQAVLESAGGTVVTLSGNPLRYGKVETKLRNPGFIAWGRLEERSRFMSECCDGSSASLSPKTYHRR